MEYKHKISCSKQNLGELRSFVKTVLRKHKVPEKKAYELVLAVDEVCTNLVVHSNNCNPEEKLTLRVRVNNEDTIEFVFFDQGVAFNSNAYSEPRLPDLIKKKRKGGLGMVLVRRIMDQVEYSKENDFNVCRLVKKL